MAAGRPRDNHEEIRVKIKRAERELLPAVQLEKKEIRMTVKLPEQTVPSIVMTTFENGKPGDADRIVGIGTGPQGIVSTLTTGVPPKQELKPEMTRTSSKQTKQPLPNTERKPVVEHGDEEKLAIMEKTEDLMEFFEDQEKTHQALPKRSASRSKPRTPSPSPIRQSIGLDHLDNLVRLMEQLRQLRDENVKLKNKCEYLESTKTLLQAKSHLEDEDVFLTYKSNSLPRPKKQKSSSQKSTQSEGSAVRVRPRLPSAEDAMCIEMDYDSDISVKKPRMGGLYKRSYSTGSLEVPSDIMEQSGEDDLGTAILSESYQDQVQINLQMPKSQDSKRKSKFSKWAKVKKVLKSQQLTENISSGIKSIKGFGKGAYLKYGTVSSRELAVPLAAESKSLDSGVGSGMDTETQESVRKSTSSGEPPSPTSKFMERHIDVPTPNIDDDCMGIWLGPPEWLEKEREREQEELLKQSVTTLSESPKCETYIISQSLSELGKMMDDGHLHAPLPRRQSSPMLIDGDESHVESGELHRTCSYTEEEELYHKVDKEKKLHKTPWGRMKHMMHTGRKDSVKKKHRKGKDTEFPFEDMSEIDIEGYEADIKPIQEEYLEGPVSRSTPKTSPVVYRQKHRDKSCSDSPPGVKGKPPKGPSSGGNIDVTALLGTVTDDFSKKLQEWEEKKVKRSSGTFKESPEYSEGVSYESAGAVSPEFLKKLEEWEKVKALKGVPLSEKKRDSQIEADADSSGGSDDEGQISPDRHPKPVTIEEIQKKLSDSFSRKMEEWERQKYRRQNSQSYESREGSQKSYKPERQKSKKTKEEKEREKMEKMREREILRVSREEQKLEKERLRIEKERLKALEREAKIEKMKGRLSQPDMEGKLKNPVLGPLTEYKVTSDFARKLHEWEIMKGKDVSTALYLEARKRSLQFAMEYQNASSILRKNEEEEEADDVDTESRIRKTSSESEEMFQMDDSEKTSDTDSKVKGQKPPPLTIMPCPESPDLSPGVPVSEDSSLEDNASATTDSMTAANISSLEKANALLLDELQQRELEYNTLQEEVRELNDRLVKFRDEHSKELNLYKQQLLEGQIPGYGISTDTKHMSATLTHLENKIAELKKFGDQLAMSMEGAAVGKFQSVEGEESINIRLVDLLDKMRLVLQQASAAGANTLEDVSRKSSALHNFEKLYSQAMQLQVQMNNLRLSQLERNKEIMNMKRHLLLQEANNLLLQADITRREAELLHYKEYARKGTPIKRWNTFSGEENRQRLPGREAAEKESIFQRVQRLRSARGPISSTTDSDSEDAKKPEPVKRKSPKQQRRSPKTARKSPSPRTKKKESPKLSVTPHPPIKEVFPERSIERIEEHIQETSKREVRGDSKIKGDHKEGQKDQSMDFSTLVLPTAGVKLPKDISGQEMNGVPRKQREKSDTPPSAKKIQEVKEIIKVEKARVETSVPAKSEPKFPELLIPEWKKLERSHLIRMPAIEPDEVFESDDVFLDSEKTRTISEQLIMPRKAKFDERSKMVNTSFESNGSEDTLKYMSPEASPAPKFEPPVFPSTIEVVHRIPKVLSETVSDPGQSRPNSLVRVSVSPLTPLLSRKPPSGQRPGAKLNIPVIPLKRIKPAQELLEDSQKYRSGHSIYLTRILKRYPMKIECRSRSMDEKKVADKENIREGYVRTMVKQLSREGTPDQKSSSSTPKYSPSVVRKADSPKQQSDFVQHLVDKLSKPCGPELDKHSIPLKDLTNEGQVKTLTQAFANGSAGSLPERTFTEDEKNYFLRVRGSEGNIKPFDSSLSSTSIAFSQLSTKTEPTSKPDMAESQHINYSSMPLLSLEREDINQGRERSATTSGTSPVAQEYHPPIRQIKSSPAEKSSPTQRHKIHIAVSMSPGRSRRVLDPKLSPGRLRRIHEANIEQVKEEPSESLIPVAHSVEEIKTVDTKSVPLRSPKAKRKEKTMDTVGVLCRQSLTFDLGISGSEGSEISLGAGAEAGSQPSPIRFSASSTSSQSETEITSETSDTTKKKKSRHKFLESSFIQKSRKFFKVSKETRCPSLECCGSDREFLMTEHGQHT